MNKGWISINRKIQDHWLWKDKREFSKLEAWLDILLTVNHTDKKVLIKNTLFTVKRGESINSLDTWSYRWNWNKSKVRRFLKMLENDSMIVTKNERKTTRLTVCKYDCYQDTRNADETQMKHKRNADETQMTPNNNDNNYNNETNNKLNYIPKSQKDFKAEDKIKDIEVIEPEEVEFDFDEHIRTTINNFPKKEKEKSCVKKEKGIFDYQGDIMLCFNDVCQYFERDLIPQDDKDVLSWLDTIDKLNRIDGLAFSDILIIVKSARSDKFWSKNFLSLTKLRRKDKDKIPYWKVFKEKFKFEKSKSESTFDAMQQVLNEIQRT